MAEVTPIDLPLFARQGTQTQIGFRLWARPVQRDHVPEVVLAPAVAAFGHHRIQAAGRERRELLQRLMDEWQVGVDLRRPLHAANPGQAGLRQHTLDGVAVHMQLARDGAGAPFLDVVVTLISCKILALLFNAPDYVL